MKRTRSRSSHWTRTSSNTPPHTKRPPVALAVIRGTAEDGSELQLGPYESRYDIALGYGLERPIVTS